MNDEYAARLIALLWDLLMGSIVIGCAIGSIVEMIHGDMSMATYFGVDAVLARLCMVGEP